MKNIFFVFVFVSAFTLGATAQEKKLTTEQAAKKDAVELAELVGLKDNQIEDFYRLFEMKYKTLEDKKLSSEKKAELKKIMEAKIRATLSVKQMSVLESDTKLFERLKS